MRRSGLHTAAPGVVLGSRASMEPLLPCVEIEPSVPAKAAVIWLHGLGADGHDFEPIVPHLGLPEGAGVRFVFPHAPRRPVTINMGLVMPAWYDIKELHTAAGYDLAGVKESAAALAALVKRENERGVACERIVLAGFSQGGAIALYAGLRHAEPLAGILALSTYLVEAEPLATERSAANRSVPIFQAHGNADPMIPAVLARAGHDCLVELGYAVEWHAYPMGHEVHPREIRDIGGWLASRLFLGR